MIKLWLNYCYDSVMGKLWRWERVGILEYHRISMMHISFFNGCMYYDAFFEVLKSLTGKKVLLNVQNIRADTFNIVKSLKNTYKWVYFFTKNERSQSFFSKYYSLYFKDLALTLILRDNSHSFSISSRLHLTQLSSFVDSKLIKLSINALNS